MKRLDTPPATTKSPSPSAPIISPTISDLLVSMHSSGMDTLEGRLATYATLGFYFDGVDYSGKSIKKITDLIKRMDAQVPSPVFTETVEDEDNDRFGFQYRGIEYWFTSPSLNNLPKATPDQLPRYYGELIDKLADRPEDVRNLPYYLFGAVGDALGKCLGIV